MGKNEKVKDTNFNEENWISIITKNVGHHQRGYSNVPRKNLVPKTIYEVS